jgi:hypothetical protein
VSMNFSPRAKNMLHPVVGSRIMSFLSLSISEGASRGLQESLFIIDPHKISWRYLTVRIYNFIIDSYNFPIIHSQITFLSNELCCLFHSANPWPKSLPNHPA